MPGSIMDGLISNTEYRMMNNEVKTSNFDIRNSLFDIKNVHAWRLMQHPGIRNSPIGPDFVNFSS
jgi:hypothetical protein